MPGFDPTLLKQGQQATNKALQDRNALAESIAAQSSQIDSLEKQIVALNKTGNGGQTATLRAQADRLKAARSAQQTRAAEIDRVWSESVKNFVLNIDPCDADPAFPLLLLPIRLETRYTPDGKTLRIRIFPDDIHVDQLDRGVSDDEAAAARVYWTAIWRKADGDAAIDAAWTVLVNAVGVARAAWVSIALTPSNLTTTSAVAPEFPAVVPPLRRAALARLLPDRFVAIALQGADRSNATGATVSPELVTGLLSDDGSDKVTVNGVPVPPGAEWLVDYNKAVAAGMAINLPLKKASAAIDQLFVCGVRSSLDPVQSEQELAKLFTAHRCARGLAFLPQGTPSNNTESDRAAWTQRPQPTPPARTAPAAGSNAAVFANALGIDSHIFAGIAGSDLTEQGAARAMESALWSPTWGSFLHSVNTVNKNGSVLTDERKEQTRAFFCDNVRARGSLPSIRVGQQPYGIVPATSLSDKRWKTPAGDSFEAALLPLLRRIRNAWQASAGQTAHMGSGAPVDSTLRDVLGLSPISQGLRVRSVLSNESYLIGSTILNGKPPQPGAFTDADAMGSFINQMVYEDLNMLSFSHPFGSLEKNPRPLGLPLVDDTDPAVIDAILAGSSPKIASVLQALLLLSMEQGKAAVEAATPVKKFNDVRQLATTLPAATSAQIARLSGQGATASSKTLHALANEIVVTTGEAGVSRLDEYQPARQFQTSLGDLAIDSTLASSKATLASYALAAWARESAKLAEVREAMVLLKTLSKDDRRILLCETLDLASHRLDAWLLGIVERRRTSQRAAKPSGIAIGAYGWVENIAPGKGLRPDGGYVHAPSIDHAATAGILRSAYMTHNPDASGGGAFAIDLSSARVRTALDIIDGVRQGQPLGALLGYRIERGLHEARLDRFALTLRSLAPLSARRLTDRGEAAGTQAQASVTANNVVDGLRLIDLFRQNSASIRSALTAVPTDNPYIKPADWPAVSNAEWDSFTKIVNSAAQAADAAADLLLAESVHQMVQGNMSGSAAALDAVASGDSPPPDADIVRTPSPGTPFAHRLLIASPASLASGVAGWNTARPRAHAEPRLEQWAQLRLGGADKIIVASAGGLITLDQASLCALDLIYDAGDLVQFEQRIRAALPAIPAAQALAERTDPAWPKGTIAIGEAAVYAASLRGLLVNAQPCKPADLVRTNETPTRSFSAAEIADAAARATFARGGLISVRDGLNTAITNFVPENSATVQELRKQLEAVAAYGLVTPIADGEHLLSVAQVALAEASHRIDDAATALALPADDTTIVKASQSLFGDGFWILPAIGAPATPDLLSSALGPTPYCPAPPRSEVRRFIRDIGSVRNNAARLSEALLLADGLGRPHTLRVAQLVEAGLPGGNTWIGGAIDLTQPTPRNTITNLVFDTVPTPDPVVPMIALTIEGWTDVIPVRERRGSNATDPLDERRVSGIAINAAAASARPPQAMLLAISPDGARWTTDAVLDTLSETLSLAKIRAVTLETTPGYGRVLPAIYEASYSLQGERVFDLRAVAALQMTEGMLPYLKGNA